MTARLVAITCILLAAAVVLESVSTERVLPPRIALRELPLDVGSWRSVNDHEFDAATLAVLRADDHVGRTYTRGAESADLFIAYYASQQQGHTIHSPMNCLPATGWQPLSASRLRIDVGAAAPIDANRYVIQKGLERQLVIYWYQNHQRTVASEYAAKAYLVLDSLKWSRSDAALVRIVSPIRRGETVAERSAIDFVRAVHPLLGRHLPG
jgi:EpsI family protein